MGKAVIACNDPDDLIKKTAMAIKSIGDVQEATSKFNAEIMDAGNNKIGAANQKLLEAIVSVGGAAMDKVCDALTVRLNDDVMEPAFSAYKAATGEAHPLDTLQ